MADRDFLHAGHGAQKVSEVGAVQVVAGIDAQACGDRCVGGRGIARELGALPCRAMRCRIRFGVELDAIGADGGHVRHHFGVGVHEQADAHAERPRLLHQGRDARQIGDRKAVVARELPRRIGHERGLLRPMLAHEGHQVVERVAFDVELGLRPLLHQRREVAHVLRTDVALVRTRVHGDALRSRFEAQRCRAQHARDAEVTRVAQMGDLVDIDRQRTAAVAVVCIGGDQRIHRDVSSG